MKKILGIIGAEQQEIDLLLHILTVEKSTLAAGMKFYQGCIHNYPVVIVKAGVGKVNAAACAQLLISQFHAEIIVNTGAAGSLDAAINIGDIVISTEVIQHDMDVRELGYSLGTIPDTAREFYADTRLLQLANDCCQKVNSDIQVFKGRILTGDQFVSGNEKKEFLVKEFQGLCTEMEGGAIAQVASLNQVPFLIIRAISDKADGSATLDYPTFSKMASIHSAKLVEAMIEVL